MNRTDAGLDQVVYEYRARLAERARQLGVLAQAWSGGDAASQQELLQQLHRLAGSAGMYGLNELSQQAKLAHHAIKQSTQADTANARHALEQVMLMMREAVPD